jgi:hypothetical protein
MRDNDAQIEWMSSKTDSIYISKEFQYHDFIQLFDIEDDID